MTSSNLASLCVVPGAPAEKLPFVHSKFKPNSKFAKSFGGYNRVGRPKAGRENDVKLPRITYSCRDQRTMIAFGSLRRGARREYAGFAGQPKPYQRKRRRAGKYNLTSPWQGIQEDSFLPVSQHSSFPALPGASHPRESSDSQSSNGVDHGLLPNMDSLFIVDDDEVDERGDRMKKTDSRKNSVHHHHADVHHSERCPRRSQEYSEQETKERLEKLLENDTFAVGVVGKLRDDRGKSGVKRDRKQSDMRRLGDVITSQRLNELLTPRNRTVSFRFND